MKIKNLGMIFLFGLLLNISFFIHNINAQLLALVLIAPVFYFISKIHNIKERYLAGILYFGAWLIPTTYWYYLIFPWWSAFLRSFGFVTLMALLFIIPTILWKRRDFVKDSITIIVCWTLLTTIRIIAPITEDWWIPHLAYTQWLNPLIVQIASFASVYGIIFVILMINFTAAYFLWKRQTKKVFLLIITVIFISLLGNAQLEEGIDKQEITLIGIQKSPENVQANHDDVEKLKMMTKKALEETGKNNLIFIVWPENMIKSEEDGNIKNFVEENEIYLVYNREELNGNNFPFNTAVILNPEGEVIQKTHKRYAAPTDRITISDQFSSVTIDGFKVTTDICYDLHYPDIKERLKGNDFLFAPFDDRNYGKFQPYLHAADVVFRAVENNINIMTASTNGPTFFVNKKGVVVKKPLKIYEEGVLIVKI